MNKRQGLTILTAVFMLLVSFQVLAVATTSITQTAERTVADKFIQISMVNQEPDPVEPGQYVTATFKIVNYGSEDTGDIVVGIQPEFPFTLFSGQDVEQNLGILESRQFGDKSEVIEWDLLVDKDAAEGESVLKVYYKELTPGGNAKIIYEEEFEIEIRTSDTILNVENIATVPESLQPGQKGQLSLDISNLADSFVKDVKIQLDLESAGINTVGSTDTRIIQKLNGGATKTLTFDIISNADTEVKVHSIPIELTFKDNLNTEYTQNESFGLPIESEIQYVIYIEDTAITQTGQAGEVTFRISNPGVADINFLTTELIASPNYDIISTPYNYVGKVDTDDYESVSYTLYAKDTEDDVLPLRLLVTYKDSYNNEFTSEEEIPLRLFSSDEAKKFGLTEQKSSGGLFIIIIIIIAGVGYYFWRKRKKKKK